MIYQSVGVSARAGTVPSGRGRKKDGAAGLCRATCPVAAQCAAGGVDGPGQLPIDLYKGEVAARQRSGVGGRHRTRAGGVEMYLPRYAAAYTWYSVPSYISHCPRVPSQGPYSYVHLQALGAASPDGFGFTMKHPTASRPHPARGNGANPLQSRALRPAALAAPEAVTSQPRGHARSDSQLYLIDSHSAASVGAPEASHHPRISQPAITLRVQDHNQRTSFTAHAVVSGGNRCRA